MNPKTPTFSQRLNDTLVKIAIIDEMARVDSWQGLDECLENNPSVVKKLALYADAALRAIKQMENENKIELLEYAPIIVMGNNSPNVIPDNFIFAAGEIKLIRNPI
jgi:hypothetical protein